MDPKDKKDAVAQYMEDNPGKPDPSWYCETDRCWQKVDKIPFFGERHLTKHMNSHKNGLFHFECFKCDLGFTWQVTLDSHNSHFHPQLKLYQCNPCQRTFQSGRGFDNHNKEKHSGGSAATIQSEKQRGMSEDESQEGEAAKARSSSSEDFDNPMMQPDRGRRLTRQEFEQRRQRLLPLSKTAEGKPVLEEYEEYGTIYKTHPGGFKEVVGPAKGGPIFTADNVFSPPKPGTIIGFRNFDDPSLVVRSDAATVSAYPSTASNETSRYKIRLPREHSGSAGEDTSSKSRESSLGAPDPKRIRRDEDTDTEIRRSGKQAHGRDYGGNRDRDSSSQSRDNSRNRSFPPSNARELEQKFQSMDLKKDRPSRSKQSKNVRERSESSDRRL